MLRQMAYPMYLRKGFIVTSDKPYYTLGKVFRVPGMIWEPRNIVTAAALS